MNLASLVVASPSVDAPSQLLAVCSLNDEPLSVEKVVAQFPARGEQIVTKEGRMVGITKKLLRDALEQASTNPDKYSYKFWYQKDGSARYCVKKIGSGASCTVYLFIDLVEHKAGAFKKPRKKDPHSEFGLRQEFDILQELNAGGPIWGIQQRPLECLTIYRKSQKTPEYKQRRGVLHPLYQGPKSDGIGCDYIDHLNSRGGDPLDVTLLRVHQLLHALQFLHERNYLHGDIKLENVLLEKLWTHLTDFATAVTPTINLRDFFSGKMPVRPKLTTSNSSKQDLLDSDRCVKMQQLEELRAIEKSREVFAMGVAFATALNESYPFEQDSHGFAMPNTYKEIDDLEPEIGALVTDMCSFKRALRPDAILAYKRLHLYIKTNKPLLYEEIKKLIRDGGYVAPQLD